MTGNLPEVWSTRDYPVLVEAVRLIDGGERSVDWTTIADSTGMPPEVVKAAFRALERRGLVRIGDRRMSDATGAIGDVAGEAYLLTGLHPNGDEAISRLIDALRQAADQVDDPEERSRLSRLADNAGSVSCDVLAAVLATVITGGIAG